MIVILHGWGQSKKFWENFTNKIDGESKSFDLPGFGKEPLINEDWGIPQYADWVETKLKNYKEVVLLGHSFGGRISAEVASRSNKNIKALILSGAPCLYRPSTTTLTKIKLYKSLKNLLPKKARQKFYSRDLKDSREKNLEKIFRNVVVYDQTNQLKKIIVPTLLIWGKNDDQVPLKIALEMKDLIKNSNLKIIEDAGHNAYLNKPDLFYGYVKTFISNL